MKDIISMTIGDMKTEIDNGIMRAVRDVGINVSKEELIKALELNEKLVRCKECKHGKYEFTDNKDWIYCKHHYDYWTADDFCSYGERKETDHE